MWLMREVTLARSFKSHCVVPPLLILCHESRTPEGRSLSLDPREKTA